MLRTPTVIVVAAVAALVLAACAGEPEDPLDETDAPADDEPGDEEPGQDEQDAAADGDEVPASLQEQVEAAIADVSDRTGADAAEVTVVTAEEVTWPDGSIGCPDPDEMYTMALVEGYRIILEVDGEEHAYHGQDGEPPFHCEDPQDPAEGDGRVTS